jgi:hypothetical protein
VQLSVAGGGIRCQDAAFWLAEMVQAAFDEQIERERQTGQAIGKNAILADAARDGLAGQGLLSEPQAAAAESVLPVAEGQWLTHDEPEALGKKQPQQHGGDALRTVKAEAADAAKVVGHGTSAGLYQSKRLIERGAILTHKQNMSTVYTIGHSSHTVEEFVALLLRHDIEVLVDVRSAPYSKFAPQFDRELLPLKLTEAGIRYLYLGGQIGGRPKNASHYDATGRVVYGRMATEPEFLSGIERLETGMSRYRVALMCGEENPTNCHRRLLISRVLLERGHQVEHIRGDGRLESDAELTQESGKPLVNPQPGLFAEIEEDQWRSTVSVLPKKTRFNSSER